MLRLTTISAFVLCLLALLFLSPAANAQPYEWSYADELKVIANDAYCEALIESESAQDYLSDMLYWQQQAEYVCPPNEPLLASGLEKAGDVYDAGNWTAWTDMLENSGSGPKGGTWFIGDGDYWYGMSAWEQAEDSYEIAATKFNNCITITDYMKQKAWEAQIDFVEAYNIWQ